MHRCRAFFMDSPIVPRTQGVMPVSGNRSIPVPPPPVREWKQIDSAAACGLSVSGIRSIPAPPPPVRKWKQIGSLLHGAAPILGTSASASSSREQRSGFVGFEPSMEKSAPSAAPPPPPPPPRRECQSRALDQQQQEVSRKKENGEKEFESESGQSRRPLFPPGTPVTEGQISDLFLSSPNTPGALQALAEDLVPYLRDNDPCSLNALSDRHFAVLAQAIAHACVPEQAEHIIIRWAPDRAPVLHGQKCLGSLEPPRGDDLSLPELVKWVLLFGLKSRLGQCIERMEKHMVGGKVPMEALVSLLERSVDTFSLHTTQPSGRGNHRGRNNNSEDDATSQLLPSRVATMLSEEVCDRLEDITADMCTRMICLLTGGKVPMDEFWVFMLAKRLTHIIDETSADDVATVAEAFASRNLEDDMFFFHLTQRMLHLGLHTFTPEQIAQFVYACSVVRYRDETLLRSILDTYAAWGHGDYTSDECKGRKKVKGNACNEKSRRNGFKSAFSPRARGHLIAGFVHLDTHNLLPHISSLFRSADQQVMNAFEARFLDLKFLFGCMYYPVAAHSWLPYLTKLTRSAERWTRAEGGPKGFARRFHRIIYFVLATRAGVLGELESFPLPCLRVLAMAQWCVEDPKNFKTNWLEPTTSGFQLEVASILTILKVPHSTEVRRVPFILDLVLKPESSMKEENEPDYNSSFERMLRSIV